MRQPVLSFLATLLLIIATMAGAGARQSTPAPMPVEPVGAISVAGSATLGPVVEARAEAFAPVAPEVTVEFQCSSSGAGIEQFCAGEIDIATSRRTMRDEEMAACEAAGIAFSEFEVAFDGVAVVVHPDNADVTCLPVEQLGQMW